MRAEITVPLVVRQDEDDVGSFGGERCECAKQQSGEQSHGGRLTMSPPPQNATPQP